MIARQCQISEATVKVHIKAILRKTRAPNRTQAAIWAVESGFLDPLVEEKVSVPNSDTRNLSPALSRANGKA
jgi:two-component system, NarL family, nitrate/nitrite response regulator NarL